jgi:hypothetical protein
MKVRTPITLVLLVAATAAPAARPASYVSTTLDPAIATAIRGHETAQPVPLITEHSAGQNRLEPSAAPKYGAAPNGFDWTAAGIGATVAFAAMLLGLVAARSLPRRGRAQPA